MSTRTTLCGLGLLALLAGCGQEQSEVTAPTVQQALPREQADYLQQRYAAARRDGATQVTLYVAGPPDEWRPLWQAFAEEFPGIRISASPMVGPLLANRLASERASDQHQGDLVLSLFQDILPLSEQGFFAVDQAPTSEGLADTLADPRGRYQFLYDKRHVLVYNRQKLSAEQLPGTLDEILDERWRGRFGYYTPSGFSVADVALARLEQRDGLSDEQLQRLHELGRYGFAPDELITQVSQGRLDFALWAIASVALNQAEAGAPIALAAVDDAGIGIPFGLALLQGAPHAEAARLLKAWLFTPRAQALLAELLHYQGLMPGAPAAAQVPGTADASLAPDATTLRALASLRERTRAIWKE